MEQVRRHLKQTHSHESTQGFRERPQVPGAEVVKNNVDAFLDGKGSSYQVFRVSQVEGIAGTKGTEASFVGGVVP